MVFHVASGYLFSGLGGFSRQGYSWLHFGAFRNQNCIYGFGKILYSVGYLFLCLGICGVYFRATIFWVWNINNEIFLFVFGAYSTEKAAVFVLGLVYGWGRSSFWINSAICCWCALLVSMQSANPPTSSTASMTMFTYARTLSALSQRTSKTSP